MPMENAADRFDATYKGIHYRFTDDGEAIAAGHEPGIVDVEIPRSVKKHAVTAIGDAAFWGCDSIKTVFIRADIVYIGDWAFFDCCNMSEITLPACVSHIGCGAFRGCSSLGIFAVPDKVTYLGYAAFAGCSNLVSVSLPQSMVFLPASSFKGCSSLTDVTFSGEILEFSDNSFAGCIGLRAITIPDHVIRLGKGAFSGCTGLECVYIPDSVTEIDDDAFKGCINLRALAFNTGVKLTRFGGFFNTAVDGEKVVAGGVYRYVDEESGFEYSCSIDELPDKLVSDGVTVHGSGRFKPVSSSGVSFDDIAGLEEAKEEIRRQLIYPFTHADLYKTYRKKSGGGLLLYGPTGTGKTMLAQAVANEVHGAFFSVKSSDIVSKFDGEGEERLKDLFQTARSYPISVIFFDEFEAIGKSRGNSLQPWRDDTMSELLAQIQGFDRNGNTLMIMAATNRPWDLDTSLLRPGRFGSKVFVPLPDERARRQILESELKDVPMDGVNLEDLASSLMWFSGADVSEFTEQMKMCAILRSIESGNTEPIGTTDVSFARGKVKATVTRKDMEDFEHFAGPLKW